jgi:predicted Zn finger-like uncharacterized protein
MILTCPSCATRYQADSSRFAPPGINVRCSKCGHVWFHAVAEVEAEQEPDHTVVAEQTTASAPVAASAAAAAAAPVAAPVGVVAPERVAVLAAPTVPKAARRKVAPGLARAAAWLMLFALVGAMVWTVIIYRQQIAEAWPQTSSFYAAIGMPVNVRGLAFQDVAYTQEFEEGQPVLSITGKVVNITRRELPVPELRISLSDAEKQELYHWNLSVGAQILQPGEAKTFATRLTSPPPDARSVDVRFLQDGETP